MNQRINIFFLLLLLLGACRKEDNVNESEIPGQLGGELWPKGPIDEYINTNLTIPYNIEVKYKWQQGELPLNQALVPPLEEKIIPVIEAIRKGWIDNYVAEAGETFFKSNTPKFFVMVGSPGYNVDGTITLGYAEGGRKIVLYVLNYFRTKDMPGYQPSDSTNVKELFHTIQHEFAHILHQKVLYPAEFREISVGSYTSNWNNVFDFEAYREGFISAYALSQPDEDFVEMVSIMLTEGKEGFDNIVNSITQPSENGITPEQAKARLRAKEAIVANYFKDVWNIDFYQLQARTYASIQNLIK